jgi:enhancer of polycomb-like protein
MLSPHSRVPGLKLRTSEVGRSEPVIRPKDRIALIREQIETTLEQQKAIDHPWEDLANVSRCAGFMFHGNSLDCFRIPINLPLRHIPPNFSNSSSLLKALSGRLRSLARRTLITPRRPRAVRMQYGRGGRVFLDRRDPIPQRLTRRLQCSSLFALAEEDGSVLSEGAEEAERQKRLEERWKFNINNIPPNLTVFISSQTQPHCLQFRRSTLKDCSYRLGGLSFVMRRDLQ